jgi:vacuolar-type H+-ATPase subunit D/Vma8
MTDLSIYEEINSELLTNTDVLKRLVEVANELNELEEQAAAIEELLKKINGRTNAIKIKEIPVMMAQIGQIDFTLSSGFRIALEDFIAVQDVKDKKKKAVMIEKRIEALGEMEGGDALIRTEVTLPFEKRQHNEALALVDE